MPVRDLMHIAMGMYGMLIVDPKDGRTDAREFSLVQSEIYRNMDMQAMTAGRAAAVVFNGRADQYKENPLTVRVGEPVRLYVVNAGPDHFSAFHVVGTIFDRVEPDGNPKNAQYGVSTYTLAPGGGAVFETHFDEPGKYPFVTHSFGDATLGAVGVIEVTP
ncbi:MAG: multicopper oxidase domain-containing protein [Firmicutes bacterium]|nr:multicopper oxidase domain-containing protein [Bacillota bacterium]